MYQDWIKYMHVWCGERHHIFKQTLRVERSSGDDPDHKPSLQMVYHPQGSVVAPMSGLVVKVLVKKGESVMDGQPMMVLEAMKMEHVVKAPAAGYVCGLQVTPGQQIADSSVLFSIKDEYQ